MMTADDNLAIAKSDRLQKSKTAWVLLRKTFVTNINLPIEFRLIIFHAIIGSILYSLHLFILNKTNRPNYKSSTQNASGKSHTALKNLAPVLSVKQTITNRQ